MRANVTACWLALLIVAATETSMTQGHYQDLAMQLQFQRVEAVVQGRQRRVEQASEAATQAQIAANKAESIGAQFVAALGVAGIAITVSGWMWGVLFGASILIAGRAAYTAAQALGAI